LASAIAFKAAGTGVSVNVADTVVPLYDALIVTGVDTATLDVVMVNVALLLPEAIVTLAGTTALALDDVRVITAPCVPAVPVRVTVFCVVGFPPTTDVGFRTTAFSVGATG